ncbi:MAG: hypothetical protein EU532_12050 [Promethearchaeota archaeon]|nr:MAG: hypothetical protein EU532_12050 [Candidatus Lokiarchaeota archaeon]
MIEIIILVLFFLIFGVGFFLIYKQVALVKKGELNFKDRLQCLIYGFLFSSGIMVVISMGFIFTDNTVNPVILTIPLFICLIYVSFYPLVDFLFIALSKGSDEGLTPFHSFLSQRFINIFKNKLLSALMAIFLYLIIALPPIILTLTGLPFSLLWISWMLFYPLLILTYYGTKGYIAGISAQYYSIPEMKRSIFLNFEDQKRGMSQFFSNPTPFIVFGMMLFVFVWAWISLIQTVAFFFTGSLAISTMSSYFVYVTLFFGIIGYFTRFWGRKIKYRGIDIYFAAYLMAAIGINVLVNFLLVNIGVLSPAFNSWEFTKTIIPHYSSFSWAAIIEESILITITSYFLISQKSKFKFNIKYSKITESGQRFDPIPLFTLIKNKDPIISKYAEETIRLMFERIPLKSKSLLNDWRFKNSLIDGICDYNLNSQRICYDILVQLEKDAPDIILNWIVEALESPNYDKIIPFAKSILTTNSHLIQNVPLKVFQTLLQDSDWRIRIIGIKLIKELNSLKPDLLTKLNATLYKLVNDPSSNVQVEFLRLISESQIEISQELILEKINSSNLKVRATAIESLGMVEIDKIDDKIISDLLPMLMNSTGPLKSSIINIISRVGKFEKLHISLSYLFNALNDKYESVRDSAVKALDKYYSENPKKLDLDFIISKIDTENINIVLSIVSLLNKLWDYNPEKILTTLLILIKFDNSQLKSKISEILINQSLKYPNLILENLLKVRNDSGFVSKGIISRTIMELTKDNPKKFLPVLYDNLKSDDPDVVLNAVISLENLIDQFELDLDLISIIGLLRKENPSKVKIKGSQIISKIAIKNPNKIEPVINELFAILDQFETSPKINLMKGFLEISKQAPDLIPMNLVIENLDDDEVFIREVCTKILGYIAYKNSIVARDAVLNKSLKDKDWGVRNAAINSLGKIIKIIDEKDEIIKHLILYLEDESSWVRRSVMLLLSEIDGLDIEQIPFEKVVKNLNSDDPKIREGVANLLSIYSNNIDEIFVYYVALFGDNNKEVRANAINSMAKIIQKIGLKKILSRLLQNLSDETSLLTQQSISLILERTGRYEDEKIKKRILSLLKIRCEVSQDPIICETYNKLKEM